jgi:hypothetical protein
MRKQGLVLCTLLLLVCPLHADIYKWTDDNGNVHFSDKPQPGAETIKLPPTQTFSPPKATEPLPPEHEIARQTTATYTKIMIVQPQDQETIRSNQGLLSVITRVEPELNTGDKLQLIYDGSPVGPPQTEPAFTLKQIFRGSHTLQLQVVSEDGKVIGSSNTVTIFMHHTRIGGGN